MAVELPDDIRHRTSGPVDVIVGYDPTLARDPVDLIAATGATVRHVWPSIGSAAVRGTLAQLAHVAALEAVRSIELDGEMTAL